MTTVCDSEKPKFIKQQETSGLLSSLWIKVPLSNASAGINKLIQNIKVNEIVNKFLLARGKLILEIHLRQPELTLKIRKAYKNVKKQEIHDIFIKTN